MNDADKLRRLAAHFEDSEISVDLMKMADKIDTYGGNLHNRTRVIASAIAEHIRTEEALADVTKSVKLKKNIYGVVATDSIFEREDDFYNK